MANGDKYEDLIAALEKRVTALEQHPALSIPALVDSLETVEKADVRDTEEKGS